MKESEEIYTELQKARMHSYLEELRWIKTSRSRARREQKELRKKEIQNSKQISCEPEFGANAKGR